MQVDEDCIEIDCKENYNINELKELILIYSQYEKKLQQIINLKKLKKREIKKKTEDLVGPYELHDFFLYNIFRFGFAPSKVYFLARKAFSGVYDDSTILKWLDTFVRRFFSQQFKRSCLPDCPKVGSVSLSPRGDWRMPSDAWRTMFLKDLDGLR